MEKKRMVTERRMELRGGNWVVTEVCESRATGINAPRDITSVLDTYLPLDGFNFQTHTAYNFVGQKLGEVKLETGRVFRLQDEKRVIYEVGCDSVIYLRISPGRPRHYRYFIQPTEAFLWATTGRDLAATVAHRAGPMVTIAKYEMYFLMGMVSTVSLPALIAVVGSDITISGIAASAKARAAKELVAELAKESQTISTHLPTLHKKFEEFVVSAASNNVKRTRSMLPKTISTNEKTQGMLAGTLVGKATVSPNAFTGWVAVFTVLSTAAVKSVTLFPDTYGVALSSKYEPIVERLVNIDWTNQTQVDSTAAEVVILFKETGVEITTAEAIAIVREIKSNPELVRTSLLNIARSFEKFTRAVRD
ncbi:MAG: hypothetical protein ACR2PS_01670 [Pseudomonadales bacterium]